MRRFLFGRPAVMRSAMGAPAARQATSTRAARARPPILVILLLLLLSADTALAQSLVRIRGRVLDAEDGSPVVSALLTLAGTAFRTHTDESGCFEFRSIPVGAYALTTSMPGYRTPEPASVTVSEDISTELTVHLQREPITVEGMVVHDRRQPITSDPVVVLDRQQIKRTNPRNVADLLDEVEGVEVVNAAGSGQAHVRIRGSSSERVLVLVDGHRLSPGDGSAADINSVPVDMIERIEVHKGGASAEFGADALGGVVNIITHTALLGRELQIEAGTEAGPWRTRSSRISLSNPGNSTRLALRYAYRTERSDGDFPYEYTTEPAHVTLRGVRRNNRAAADNHFVSATAALSDAATVHLSMQAYQSSHGLPGPVSDSNLYASQEDDRTLVTSSVEYSLNENNSLELSAGWSRLEQEYRDRQSTVSQQFETHYVNDVFTVRPAWRLCPWSGARLQLGGEYRADRLDHEDRLRPRMSSGVTDRRTSAAYLTARQTFPLPSLFRFAQLGLESALRYDRSVTTPEDSIPAYPWDPPRREHRVEKWSPRLGATLAWDEAGTVVFRAAWGKSFRLPTVNALFWQGDARAQGNPDLRPELSEHSEFGCEMQRTLGGFGLAAGVTWHRAAVTDMVVWIQTGGQGVFKPINLSSARITGHEEYVKVAFLHRLIELTYQNTVTHATNKVPGVNSFDKSLTYVPAFVTRAAVRLNWRQCWVSYGVRWVDKRFALENNEKWYDAYRLEELSLGARLPISDHWRFDFDYSLQNAGDAEYVLTAQYPMPGREYRIGAAIVFTPGSNARQ